MTIINSRIVGLGHYLPSRVVTNHELEKYMETNHEWIKSRTGIHERRWADLDKETTAGMGIKASLMALERANLKPEDIDLILFATLSPDYVYPGPGVQVQHGLGARKVAAIDIRNQCSGFLYSLTIADQFIKTGMYKTILVIGSEIQSKLLDLTTRGRGVSILFGDGAGAAIVQATTEKRGILSSHMHGDGEHVDLLYLKEPATCYNREIYDKLNYDDKRIFVQMDGNKVFKFAVTCFYDVIMESLDANNFSINDLDLFVPHQANLRITNYLKQKLNLSNDQVYSNIHKYGNTSAATIPIALSELWEQGKLKDNMLISLAAFGSGFTWGSVLLRW